MPRIFISYRRDDGKDMAGRIGDWLKNTYGDSNVFTDVYNIVPGTDFRVTLQDAIGVCDIVVAVIGPKWTGPIEGSTDLRIKSANDWVRAELEIATRNNLPIIPVLIGGARVPSQDQLPNSLAHLSFLQAAPIRPDPDFRVDIGRLREAITTTARTRAFAAGGGQAGSAPQSGAAPSTPWAQAQAAKKQASAGKMLAVAGVILTLVVVSTALFTQNFSIPGFGSHSTSSNNGTQNLYNQVSTQLANGGNGFSSTTPTPTANAALNNSRKSQPYSASPAPGPNCDSAGASWDVVNGGTCLANGYLIYSSSAIVFYWYSGLHFPADQKVDVTVKFNFSTSTPTDYSGFGGVCFVLFMRASSATGARYDFDVCPDGSWSINSPAGPITSGKTTPASGFTLSATCQGSNLSLAVNGAIVGQTGDSSVAAGGDYIQMSSNGGSDSVTVSGFTFTPLS